jgi:hypothetical protein
MGKREDHARYQKSAKGRAKIVAYRKSEAGRAAQARFKAKAKAARKTAEKQRVESGTVPGGRGERNVAQAAEFLLKK